MRSPSVRDCFELIFEGIACDSVRVEYYMIFSNSDKNEFVANFLYLQDQVIQQVTIKTEKMIKEGEVEWGSSTRAAVPLMRYIAQ